MMEVGEEWPWCEERPRTPDLETVGEEFASRSVLVGQVLGGGGTWERKTVIALGWGLQAEPPRIRAGGRIYLST